MITQQICWLIKNHLSSALEKKRKEKNKILKIKEEVEGRGFLVKRLKSSISRLFGSITRCLCCRERSLFLARAALLNTLHLFSYILLHKNDCKWCFLWWITSSSSSSSCLHYLCFCWWVFLSGFWILLPNHDFFIFWSY